MHENFWAALLLTVFAGLSTGIGSSIAFFVKDRNNTKFLTLSMGFAAGVMIYVSFMEIFPHALHALENIPVDHVHHDHDHDHSHEHAHESGTVSYKYIGVIAFFVGMLLVALIDKIVPHDDNPHEFMSTEEKEAAAADVEAIKKGKEVSPAGKKRLMRIGLLTATALALHNFPEGIATFVSALENVSLGVTIAIAIALHNIPEGIAVSMPVYYATGSRSKAFWYSFLSGVVEPIGAILAYFLLMPFMNDIMIAVLLSGVAGIMVFIALDQLLPAAEEYGEHHISIYGMVAGMAVMAISLLMLNHAH
jgi:zinc transporter, ZIP family